LGEEEDREKMSSYVLMRSLKRTKIFHITSQNADRRTQLIADIAGISAAESSQISDWKDCPALVLR